MLQVLSNHMKALILVLLFFVFTPNHIVAQQRIILSSDALFKKYALPLDTNYSPEKPFYVCAGKPQPSTRIQVVRTLPNNLSILQVSSRQGYDLLKKNFLIAP